MHAEYLILLKLRMTVDITDCHTRLLSLPGRHLAATWLVTADCPKASAADLYEAFVSRNSASMFLQRTAVMIID